MLGSSSKVSNPQISDCISRNWIVVVPNHRLCPQVDILKGPLTDVRDCLEWVYTRLQGFFDETVNAERNGTDPEGRYEVDEERVVAFGTSSGGTLALDWFGFNVPRPVKAILSLYGAVNFKDPFWTQPLPHVKAKLPPILSESFINQVYEQHPIPTDSSISLEGQSEGTGTGPGFGPNFSRPRDAFALTQIANGTVLKACYPHEEIGLIDPIFNIDGAFPPTYIVHGMADTMVPIHLSRALYAVLKEKGVKCGMTEVPDEEHTFAAKMEVGSKTWDLQREGFDFLEGVISR